MREARSTRRSTPPPSAEVTLFPLVVEPDVALARERAPACDVRLDELTELAGRHRHRLDRLPGEALAKRGRGDRLVDLGVEPPRDLRGQLRRPDDAVPLHAV